MSHNQFFHFSKSLHTTSNSPEALKALFDKVAIVFGIALIPTVVVQLYRLVEHGFQLPSLIQISFLSLIFIPILFKGVFSFNARIHLIMTGAMLYGLSGLYIWGLLGLGYVTMIVPIVMVGLVLNLTYSVVYLLFGLLGAVFLAYGYVSGKIEYNFDAGEYAVSFSAWLHLVVGFLWFSCLFLYILHKLREHLSTTISNLQDRELRLAAMFNQSFQFIGLLDAKGKLLEVNQSALTFIDAKREEVIGRHFCDTPWWQSLEEQRENLNEAIQKAIAGQQVQFEAIHLDREGKFRIFDFSISPYRDHSGNILYLIPEGRDITDLKKNELAAREKANIFRAIFDHSALFNFLLSVDGYIVDHNKNIGDLFDSHGINHEDMKFWDATIWPDPEYATQAERAVKLAAGGIKNSFTAVETDNRGTLHVTENAVYPILDDNNDVIYVVVSAREITERYLAEQRVLESENRFRTLFESANDAIFIMQDDKFIDCNQKTLDLFECTREDIVDQSPFRFSPPTQNDGTNSVEKSRHYIQKAYHDGPQVFAWTHCTFAGIPFDAEVSLNRFEIKDEAFLQAIVRDVSHHVRLERELRRRRDEESLFSNITLRFLNVDPEEYDDSMDEALSQVAALLEVDACYLFHFKDENRRIRLTHFWKNDAIHMDFETDQDFPIEMAEDWIAGLLDNRVKPTSDIQEIKDANPKGYTFFSGIGVGSMLDIPMELRGKVFGFMGVATAERGRVWTDEEISFLKTVAFILINAHVNRVHHEEIVNSESKFRTIFNSSALGIVLHDTRNTFFDVNNTVLQWAGLGYEEMMQKNIYDFTPPIELERRKKIYHDMMEGTISGYRDEWPYIMPNGTKMWMDVIAAPIQAPESNIKMIMTSLNDITERKQSEIELRKLRNYLSNIVDSMPSAIIGLDENGYITQWNREAERLLDKEEHEVRNKKLSDIFPENSRIIEKMMLALENHEPIFESKTKLLGSKGDRVVNTTVYPLISSGIDGAVIRLDDVTERVRLEEMMIQTEKMMSVGGLAAGLAHEINNPLGIILQSIQNMERRTSPDLPKNIQVAEEMGIDLLQVKAYLENRGLYRYIDNIRRAGLRSSDIVRNMLSFSRKSDASFTTVVIPQLLTETVELAANDYDLKKKYDFRNIEVVYEFEEDLPGVVCERQKIQQVFLNIIKNAAQAIANSEMTRKAHIAIRTSFDAPFVRIDIADNGPGISEEARRKVFEPFFTTKPVGEGTGLGLSVSYFIITDNHKGRLEVESQPGEGTTFSVYLPLEVN